MAVAESYLKSFMYTIHGSVHFDEEERQKFSALRANHLVIIILYSKTANLNQIFFRGEFSVHFHEEKRQKFLALRANHDFIFKTIKNGIF